MWEVKKNKPFNHTNSLFASRPLCVQREQREKMDFICLFILIDQCLIDNDMSWPL